MKNTIPNIFVKFAGKNWKASLDYDEVMSLADIIIRIADLDDLQKERRDLTIAENREYAKNLLIFIHAALIREYPELTVEKLADILLVAEAQEIYSELMKMVMCAYSPKPEERNPQGCKPHLTLIRKRQTDE